jgi:hypothetical protein
LDAEGLAYHQPLGAATLNSKPREVSGSWRHPVGLCVDTP